jgi:hypothetical protein
VTLPSSPGSTWPITEKVEAAMIIAISPAPAASAGFRRLHRIKPSSQKGFAYQAITPAKIPDQPTISAFAPHITSCGRYTRPMLSHALVLVLTTAASAGLSAQQLKGVIDIHVHSDPDSVPRSIDAIDLARLAKSRGMRALVLKNHYEPTASLAYVVRKEVPGIEIFGGIDLNLTVGGVNPAAVERMTMVKGGWGRFVWMPTFDAENQVRYSKEDRPFVAVSRNGELLPEVRKVIALIAKQHLVLAT